AKEIISNIEKLSMGVAVVVTSDRGQKFAAEVKDLGKGVWKITHDLVNLDVDGFINDTEGLIGDVAEII
ncbi:MAG: hypothetical protein K9G11_04515, partial [Rickettsiaceae bacterium]|nr:hypothetical protein [Rickettsiaceae bacterium]